MSIMTMTNITNLNTDSIRMIKRASAIAKLKSHHKLFCIASETKVQYKITIQYKLYFQTKALTQICLLQ